jgi:chemotaxis protein CheD
VDKLNRTANPTIRMGEMSVATGGDELRTLLGSCVGLALHDQRHQVGGLAHIVLPNARGKTDRPGKFVDTAVPVLIDQMQTLVVGKIVLTAKLAGGANMFSTTIAASIGLQNIESCEQVLGELGIPIVAKHCGGEQGRRMLLDTASGKVMIEVVGQDCIELL